MTFNDFIRKHKLKKKATSKVKIYDVSKKMGIDSKMGIYFKVGDVSTSNGKVNLHPSKGTHWGCFINGCYFDSNGCPPPKKFLNF